VVINASSGSAFLPATAIIPAMAGGVWVVLVIPAIIAFIFGAWVFYSMVIDVSGRGTGYDDMNRCVEGCMTTPQGSGLAG
jgi:hypothetical protein